MLMRITLASTTTNLIQQQGFSKEDVGMVSSCFATSYGFSKFLGAIISDHASSRKVFSCGLIFGGLCCLFFPLASKVSISLTCAVWFVEGLLQGLGWPPCVVLLRSWYPPSQIGRGWSIIKTSGNIVAAFHPFLVFFITSTLDWSSCYYLFGVLSLSVGFLVLFTIRDSPADIHVGPDHARTCSINSSSCGSQENGLNRGNTSHPAVEQCEESSNSHQTGITNADRHKDKVDCVNGRHPDGKNSHDGKNSLDEGSTIKQSWYSVFFIPRLWLVTVVYLLLNLLCGSILNWCQLFLVQEVGMTEVSAATCTSTLQVGSIMGSFVSGYISDLLITPVSQCYHGNQWAEE